jgi:hypothetical protein
MIPSKYDRRWAVENNACERSARLNSASSRPNQALHHDRGRIFVFRHTTPLQRPQRVN